MDIVRTLDDWSKRRSKISEGTLGFVPSLGGLHGGHAMLLRRSVEENDSTVLSIFLNRTQFNEVQDLQNYPSVEAADLAVAEQCGVDVVFLPSHEDIYPDNYTFRVVSEHPLSKVMEGVFRPGHFEGVLTVVLKLLLIVKATRAYFGEKDYQQLVLVREMAKAFFLETEIVPCPTVRDERGLPLSSRHNRLTQEELRIGQEFAEVLQTHQFVADIERELVKKAIAFDYVEEKENRLFAAARIGGVRLIDNVPATWGK
ncbi:MAG: pantoate--beta-alanine ligase [Deltaproteobacteria bacterium]|nr:pantoate--beta-alanine ligase [Deltaproteobacteria bacterium]